MSLSKASKKKYNEEYYVIKEKPKREPIYIMKLELEKGNPEKIEIYPDSNPQKLAKYFYQKYNLDYNGFDYLKQKIGNLLKQHKPKNYDNEIQNKENIRNDNYNNNNNVIEKYSNKPNIDSYSTLKKYCTKTKSKISFDTTEKYYKINKTEIKHKARLKNQINQIENRKENNTEKKIKYNENNINKNNENKNKNNIKPIKNDNINNINYFKKQEEEEKIPFESEKKIKNIKNKRSNNINNKNKSQKIFKSKSCNYKNKSKNIVCSRISNEYENNKFTFHPSINGNYKTDLTFAERQTFYENLYIKRKNELDKFYSNKKVDENGNLLFKPNLISKAFYEKNNYNKNNDENFEEDIFQKNYEIYKLYELKKENTLKKYELEEYKQNNQEKMAKKINEKIFSENKMNAFINLFNDLDSDQDGIISPINININKVPKNILNIIQPLISELKEENQSLTQEIFLIAMNKLFEDISLLEKREIIKTYKNNHKINKSLDLKNSTIRSTYMDKNMTNDKLANNYYNKTLKNFYNLSNTSKNKNSKEIFYKKNNENIGKININNNFNNNISECTFNNYIKNLN